ncbi:baseplate assembly protein [Pseudomonas corrugata]|uniref:Baseplate assembly protein n=1 Tax=Pseudomonas corrugata TaxID=47879 RepID=A0A7Y6DG79_9PSED|nr:GPW/gp25 family protein [Pseudomonas corrugata]NUT85903.1 baseplate assembly protein [Pseudomonas corrugata]HCD9834331.1 GPW/gp25 family protein [Pseudomonas aeruginosa]HCE0991938.1 GPW/gp25 family protein [Pseudomonas aeruginosa]HCE3944603.1 GPW/gp25 family protein [Pseudomonas aeruginosa]
MTGMSNSTGRTLESRQHLAQSIADVLTTPIGSRVMRREYGSQLADLIDWPLNSATRLQAYAATAMALMRWEPRIRLSRVQLSLGDVAGQAILDLEGTLTDSNEPLSLRVPLSLGAAA